MKPPPRFATTGMNTVCKLQKSLYGLKQSSRHWFSKLSTALLGFDFVQSYAENSLFTLKAGTSFLVLLVYVDDIILPSSDASLISLVRSFLDHSFHIKDLGQMKYFLGLEIARSETGISLCQRKYTLELLEEASMLAYKPTPIPMVSNLKLAQEDLSQDIVFFLGTLWYLGKAKKQNVVSRSSAEAEYRAMPLHLLPIVSIMLGLNILKWITNRVHYARTKHNEVDCYFVREKLASGILRLLHVYTSHQLADLFTKPLRSASFSFLLSKMGVFDMYTTS